MQAAARSITVAVLLFIFELWIHFGFRPNNKGEPSNEVKVICKIHCNRYNTLNNFLMFKKSLNCSYS